jgi:hypothetical protein
MLYSAKHRAKRDNVPFNISSKDIAIPSVCPVLGIPLIVSKGKPTSNSPSLDKLIPELGYVKGNVNVISHRANLIKSNSSLQEIEAVLKWLQDKTKEALDVG